MHSSTTAPPQRRTAIVRADAAPADVAEADGRNGYEQALRPTEERYRSLMELMPAAVYTCAAPSGVITYFNRHAVGMWGREPALGDTEDRFCGSFRLHRPDGDLLPHDETPMAHVLAGGPAVRNQEVVIERPDGSRITVLVNIDPITDGEGRTVGAVNVFQDISDRKQLFDEVQRSEQRLRTLMEALPAAVYMTDRDGRITVFNKEAAKLWGRRPELGKDLWCGSFRIHRPDGTPLPLDQCPMAVALREGRSVRGEEIIVERPDGALVCVLPHPVPLWDDSGELSGAVNMLVDISELRRLEQELRRHVEELGAADRRKDEFLALLGHELRNPLAAIANGMEVLRRNGSAAGVEQRVFELVDRQARHMRRLIDDLLDVSRITRGRVTLKRERLDLSQLLWRVAEDHRGALHEAGLALELDLSSEPLCVDGDPTRLAQIVGNLLHNAGKFTDAGGRVTVTVRRDDGGGSARISVKDTGLGMDQQTLARLFEPFSQSVETSDRHRGGLGLGLTVVKGLAELHGGAVIAQSDGPGRGSEFTVHLPLAGGPSFASETPASTEKRPMESPVRILVVEDSKPVAEIFSMMLRELGHEVDVVASGPEAIEHVRSGAPAVVFSDISMPGMNGYELAEHLRRERGAEGVFLVAMTGFGQASDRDRALAAGFDEHLVKPVDLERLQQVLSEAARRQG